MLARYKAPSCFVVINRVSGKNAVCVVCTCNSSILLVCIELK
jgi:hypothetical protein